MSLPRGREAGTVRGAAPRRRGVHRPRGAHEDREPLRPGVCRSPASGKGLTSTECSDRLTRAIEIRGKATACARGLRTTVLLMLVRES